MKSFKFNQKSSLLLISLAITAYSSYAADDGKGYFYMYIVNETKAKNNYLIDDCVTEANLAGTWPERVTGMPIKSGGIGTTKAEKAFFGSAIRDRISCIVYQYGTNLGSFVIDFDTEFYFIPTTTATVYQNNLPANFSIETKGFVNAAYNWKAWATLYDGS